MLNVTGVKFGLAGIDRVTVAGSFNVEKWKYTGRSNHHPYTSFEETSGATNQKEVSTCEKADFIEKKWTKSNNMNVGFFIIDYFIFWSKLCFEIEKSRWLHYNRQV